MPLSTVCVSIVSNRPNRNWSSSNDVQRIFIMNSTEDIASYKAPSFHSPNFHRRTLGCSYDFPDKSYKKDKKWSIANIFRRKKKEESDTSSEEDAQKKGFLARRKKKSDNKRKKPAKNAPFDHVVAVRSPPGSRNSISYIGNCRNEESAVMSDPACIPSYIDKTQNFNQNHQQHSESFSGSVDSVRKSRRELTMARAEARRNSSKNGSSSEDESHQSNSSVVIQSEEHLDRPFSKKSRAARTERYLKRHSKDGENPHNYLRIYKSEYSDESNRSLSRSPLIPRTVSPADTKHKLSYSSLNSQSSNLSGLSTIPQPHAKFRVSNSTSNPNYKPPQSMNEYHNSMKKYANKFTNGQRSYSCDDNIHTSDILHVQFPVVRPKRGFRNLSLIDTSQLRHPPPPPPRDPNRTVLPESRPNTCYFDQSGPKAYQHRNTFSCRSTSEDHLPRSTLNVPLEIRPSSTTPESNQRFIIKHDEPVIKSVKEEYNYLTDKKPRSRKPIFIQSGNKIANSNLKENESTNKALNFWKQIDLQSSANNRKSPQMFSSHTQVQTKIFLPDKPINPVTLTPAPSLDTVTKEDIKRKSSNLEEALNELEAIYNSLKLGDEDLLDRAEQKEKEALTKKLESSKTYPSSISKGALSDSSYSYEPFDTVDSPRRKRFSKKTHNLKLDDMAFRKINKNRSNTIGDPQSVVSQVSYLMRSPVFSRNHLADNQKNNTNEPDVTLDDVVYRNVKHSNSLLKVAEPQPPFGIPLGPITPGANSDYLHAKPELVYKPVFKRKKIPDIVKDDLAFRNLRKDSNKEPALPPLSNDDFTNNSEENLKYLKKKRAQRSMSANIGNILSGNARDKIDVDNHFKTLTDIADAMEIARKVLKEKENKISLTKKAFMSDTDASYDNAKERLNFLNELRGKPPLLGDSLACKPPRGLTPERRRSPKESTPIPVSPLEDKRCESTHSSLDELLNALAEEAKETTERITKELKELSEDKENIFNKQSVSRRLTEIDQVAEKARLLENVVDSTPLITVLKNCEEEFDEEEVKSIYEEPPPAESATIVMSRYECKDSSSRSNDSEHDYENLSSDMEAALKISDTDKDRCLSPFEERKAELVATFQELKTDNKEDINETGTGEEECDSVLDVVALPDAFRLPLDTNSVGVALKTSHFPDDSEVSSGFHSCGESSHCVKSDSDRTNNLDSLESLKSPKLVLKTTLNRLDDELPKSSRLVMRLEDAGRRARNEGYRPDDDGNGTAFSSWYRDPAAVAFACSYGIACAHQLANVDLFAVLSILFAVLSFIAALFLD